MCGRLDRIGKIGWKVYFNRSYPTFMGMKKRQAVARANIDANKGEGASPSGQSADDGATFEFDFGDYQPTPLDRAQELIYDAWQARTRASAIHIAKSALIVSPDCADAYNLLGKLSHDSKAAIALYEEGVAASERVLGPAPFKEAVGHFWGVHETRPYMRARAGLAKRLNEVGRGGESISHYQELLVLNPGDNQGLRYLLGVCLAETQRHQELRALLATYDEDTACFLFLAALVEFQESGDCKRSNNSLSKATASNPYLVAYLIGEKKLPEVMPDYMGIGDELEAISVAWHSSEVWQKTPGAIAWLRAARG